MQVWGLDPNWDGRDPSSCGCGACASCRSHAANKWFASAAAADAGRAHPFCRCAVVPLVEVEPATFDALFRAGGGHASVDLRYQWVQAVLSQHPDLLPVGAPDFARVMVRPARMLQSATGKRVLNIDVLSPRVTTARIAVTRDDRTLAQRTVKGVSGYRRLRVEIPSAPKAGPARLQIELLDPAGGSKVVNRAINDSASAAVCAASLSDLRRARRRAGPRPRCAARTRG